MQLAIQMVRDLAIKLDTELFCLVIINMLRVEERGPTLRRTLPPKRHYRRAHFLTEAGTNVSEQLLDTSISIYRKQLKNQQIACRKSKKHK